VVATAEANVKPAYDAIIHSDEREAWLEARKEGIGASESATIMGLNPYQSLYTLFMERTGQIPRRGDEQNRFMDWGNRLEPVVAQAFSDETGRPVARHGILCRSRQYPSLLATPDYIQTVEDRPLALLECKTAGAHLAEQWENAPPAHYRCQVQHQLLVMGYEWGSLACLIGGNLFKWADQERNQRFQTALARRGERFMQMVRGELPPPEPDAHPSTSATLMALVADGRAVNLPDIALYWHEENVKAAREESEAKKRKEEYRDLLRAAMGRASYGILPGDNGMYKFVAVHKPEVVLPASDSRQLRHNKKVKLPKGAE
jgi:putative phage-type endonuclease